MQEEKYINYKHHIQKILETKHSNHIFIYIDNEYIIAKADTCLYSILGSCINIYWHQTTANMIVQKSNQKNFAHIQQSFLQIFQKVQFRHAFKCPLLNANIQGNQHKKYKSCACVMLQHNNKFLITRRGLNLTTFSGAWVLPGGHLQKHESIIEGGLRQCQQQVGLDHQIANVNIQKGVMCWQSVYAKDSQVISCGLVVFFNAEVSHEFEVQPHQHQVEQFKWKQFKDYEGEHRYTHEDKNGYGEAHLNYLSFFRKNNFQIQQDKKWEHNYKQIN